MPDILPPQLVGVHQRPLYVKVRTALTIVSIIWLLLAITGVGFFSGGTTSLALSLVLLYGTGTALIVVIAAIYRLVKNSAVKRTETAPDDTAAVAFVDTARSATEELLAALRPAAATGRPAAASPRVVRAAVSGNSAETTAASVTSSGSKPSVQKQAPASAKPGTPTAKTGKTSPAKQHAPAKQKTGPGKSAPKSALNKAVPNKNAAGKQPAPGKTVPAKSSSSKAGVKSAQRAKGPSKAPQGRTVQAKGRPGNNGGSATTPAKGTGSSANRQPGKKQQGTKDSAGSVGSGDQACSAPQKPARPALVLASSNTMPQPRQQHVPDTRKRAS